MKKPSLFRSRNIKDRELLPYSLRKWILVMKLAVFILVVSLTQISAKGYAQTATISGQRVSLTKVFRDIQKQTGYNFLCTKEQLAYSKKVDIHLKDAPLNKVLEAVFKDQPLTYQIFNKTIIVKHKAKEVVSEEKEVIEIPSAQISGVVIDSATGKPLAGVTIQVKGTTAGTTTDENGRFNLEIPNDEAALIVSYLGYVTKEVHASRNTPLNIALASTTAGLDQLVVIGYGSEKKRDITGSVTVVDVEDLTKQPTGLVSQQLQGQASGVTVTGSGQPGEKPQVLIRGINTFGNNTPLYIINGVPSQDISNLIPTDIASIQVLKDAGAASIYGSRASNGVIIITTKEGKGNLTVSYDGYYGTQWPRSGNPLNLLNPMEQAKLRFLASANSGLPISSSNPDPMYGSGPNPILPDYIYPVGATLGDPSVDPSNYYVNPFYTSKADLDSFYRINPANKAGTDWFHEIFRPAPITSHSLSINGGNEKANYFFSVNYLNQQGTANYTYLKRYSIRSNTQFKISDRIKIGENLQYTVKDNPTINARHISNYHFYRVDPIVPVYDIMGNFAGTYGTKLGGKQNPVAEAYRTRNNKNINHGLFGNVYADAGILENLTFHTSFGANIYSGYSHSFNYPQYENNENNDNNSYDESSNFGFDWTWTNTLNYSKKFNEVHDLNVLVGVEAVQEKERSLEGSTSNYFSFDPNFVSLSTGSGEKLNSSSVNSFNLWSQFVRLNYGYKDKYLLGFTLRRDGSSRFLKEHRFGWFPSVSGAWRLSQENFLNGNSWITDLKLRASYGVMGNQMNVPANNAYNTFVGDKDGSYYDIAGTNNSLEQGFQVGHIGNPAAKWERDANTDIGIDASFFNGRYNLTIDYFHKQISGLLYNPILLATAGRGTVPFVNVAGMTNKGIDFSFSSYAQLSKYLKFNGTLSFTSYENVITKISNIANYFDTPKPGGFSDQSYIRNQVGHAVSSFHAYRVVGFWNSQAEIDEANNLARSKTENNTAVYQTDIGVGRFRYADVNGDGIITPEDRTFLGNAQPDFTYGLNLGLNYKDFDFSIFLYGVYGDHLFNVWRSEIDFYGLNTSTKRALYDSWTPDHKDANAPIQELTSNFSTSETPNSYYIEKGSYLRAKNAQIGYTFPAKNIKKVGIQKFRIYVQAGNLFTITNYSGLDPEVLGNLSEYGIANQGVDDGTYVTPHQFVIGVNLKF